MFALSLPRKKNLTATAKDLLSYYSNGQTDGFGVAYLKGGKLKIFKSDDAAYAYLFRGEKFPNIEGKAVIGHDRTATSEVCYSNTHPLLSEDGKIALIHNGFIGGDKELRAKLEAEGHVFSSKSVDSEVLLHMYEKYGKDFITETLKADTGHYSKLNTILLKEDGTIIAVSDGNLYSTKLPNGGTLVSTTQLFKSSKEIDEGDMLIIKDGKIVFRKKVFERRPRSIESYTARGTNTGVGYNITNEGYVTTGRNYDRFAGGQSMLPIEGEDWEWELYEGGKRKKVEQDWRINAERAEQEKESEIERALMEEEQLSGNFEYPAEMIDALKEHNRLERENAGKMVYTLSPTEWAVFQSITPKFDGSSLKRIKKNLYKNSRKHGIPYMEMLRDEIRATLLDIAAKYGIVKPEGKRWFKNIHVQVDLMKDGNDEPMKEETTLPKGQEIANLTNAEVAEIVKDEGLLDTTVPRKQEEKEKEAEEPEPVIELTLEDKNKKHSTKPKKKRMAS